MAIPAFDVHYDQTTGDSSFDDRFRSDDDAPVEFGQLTHTNSKCNDNFKVVLDKWRETYSRLILDNKFPVFFDMEQSANVLALASWDRIKDVDEDGIVQTDEFRNEKWICCCSKNPLHILSWERIGAEPSSWNLEEYS